VDEYRDYGKGMEALKEALKHAQTAGLGERAGAIQQRIGLMARFLDCQNMFESKPAEMLKGCQDLLDMPNINEAVRIGDIISLMIEYHYERKDYQECYALMRKMQEKGASIKQFVDQEVVATVAKACGKKRTRKQQEDEVEEDIRD
jgi:hypothetical protein